MSELSKILIITGLAFLAAGILLAFTDRIPFLGKLPGDIVIRRDGFRLYIPIASSLLLSVGLSLVLWLVSYFKNR